MEGIFFSLAATRLIRGVSVAGCKRSISTGTSRDPCARTRDTSSGIKLGACEKHRRLALVWCLNALCGRALSIYMR